MKSVAGCAALFLALALAPARAAAQGTPAPTLEPVLSGLSSPVFLTSARDGTNRLFVVEQPGRILVLQPGATTPTVFLDITSKVLSGGEQGLLGLAFHPQFALNRRLFVNYTRQPDGATVIAEYQVITNPNAAEQGERVILVIPQPFANHNGGMIAFGPDGFLYVGMGDGGSANDPGNRAQNVEELLGKMLRIDVNRATNSAAYVSPPDNPFFGPAAGRDEIYATGLRNPFRFSFDRQTGQLYLGDVGQGAREEIDIITRGGNYGWRVFEGTLCTNLDPAACNAANFQAPVAEYGHTGGRCSVTGGYVYRGTRATLPAGAYVFADYCTGEIFLLQGTSMSLLSDTALRISSFGEDEAGEIYVVGHTGGTVHRLTNASCTYTLSPASRTSPAEGETFTVNVTTQAGCVWSAASNSPFVTVPSGVGGTGSGSVAVTVAPVVRGGQRVGTVSIAGQTLTITQSGCFYQVNPDRNFEFPAEGGQGSFQMVAPASCEWRVSSLDPEWLTITAGAVGAGTATVTFSVAANPGPQRAAQILRTDDSFITVLQAAGGSAFGFGDPTSPLPGEGGTHVGFRIVRFGDLSRPASVTFQTVDDPEPVPCATVNGKAYARCDYATTVETLTWAAGDSETKTVFVPLINDSRVEGPETFQVRLSNPQGGILFGSGVSTITIEDNDAAEGPNPIFQTPFFVRMHYLDFLSREPEAGEPWTAVLNGCPNVNNTDPNSPSAACDRVRVSQSFFLSPEFRLKGFYAYLFYRVAFDRRPEYSEIIPDMRTLAGATPDEVFARRAAYATAFTQRPEFTALYGTLTNQQYVEALLGRYGLQQITTEDPQNFEGTAQVTLTRQQMIDALNNNSLTRAQVLRAVVQSTEVDAAEFHGTFVAMQYYAYLRRAPEQTGYDDWLRVIRQDPNNIRIMVNGFVNSREYKLRFGQP
ncbi:MAG TPA: PQQ-dependent sugar dehydrogenase [Pyrinomonadaceae bacterium]|nr:PQQ-dependent sugar dehydrogenase [Pyrinomonadaceae bacterium]